MGEAESGVAEKPPAPLPPEPLAPPAEEPVVWSPEVEVCLFHAMLGHKPVDWCSAHQIAGWDLPVPRWLRVKRGGRLQPNSRARPASPKLATTAAAIKALMTVVPKLLVEIHLKLMRKIGKSVSLEKWEKYLTRICQNFNTTWAWEMEKKGYQEMTVECKLGMLKHLCECQFDDNVKFRNYVNEEDADTMRLQPIGRDKDGLMYWYHLDQDHNIRLYIEEQDDQDGSSWKCIVRTRNELAETLELLKAQIDPALLKKPDQQDASSNDSPVPDGEEIKAKEGTVLTKDEKLPLKEEKGDVDLKEEKPPDLPMEEIFDEKIVKVEDQNVKEKANEQLLKEVVCDKSFIEKIEEKSIEEKGDQSKESKSQYPTGPLDKSITIKLEKCEEVLSSVPTPKLLSMDNFIESKAIKLTKEESDSFKENVKPTKVEIKENKVEPKDSEVKIRPDKAEVERPEISVIVRCSQEVTEKSTDETEKIKNDQQAKIPLKKREIKLTEDFDSRSRGSLCKSITPTKEILREEGKVDDECIKQTPMCSSSGHDGKPLVNGEMSSETMISLCKTKTVIVNLCSTKENRSISSKDENGVVVEKVTSVIKSVATAKTENNVAHVNKALTCLVSEKVNQKELLNIVSLSTIKQHTLADNSVKEAEGIKATISCLNKEPEVASAKSKKDFLPEVSKHLQKLRKSETLSCREQSDRPFTCIKMTDRSLSSCEKIPLSFSEKPPENDLPCNASKLSEAPLSNSKPPKRILSCVELSKKPLSCSEPCKKLLMHSEPQEKSLCPNEPAEKSVSCSEPAVKSVSCSEPPEKPVSCSKPPEKPVSCSEPPEKPVSCSEPSEKPVSCSEPPEKPVSCSELPEKPVSCSELPEKPVSCSEQPEKPVSCSEPPEKAVSCSEPPEKPVSCSEQPEKLVSCEQPEKLVTCSQPPAKPVSCTEPPEKPMYCSETLEKASSCDPTHKDLSSIETSGKTLSSNEPPDLVGTRKRVLRSKSKKKPNLSKTESSTSLATSTPSEEGVVRKGNLDLDSKHAIENETKKTSIEKEELEPEIAKKESDNSECVLPVDQKMPPKAQKKTPTARNKTKQRLPSEEENSGTESKEMTSERQKDGLKLTIRIANRKKKPEAPVDDLNTNKEAEVVKSQPRSVYLKKKKDSEKTELVKKADELAAREEAKNIKSLQTSEVLKTPEAEKCCNVKTKIGAKKDKSLLKSVDLIVADEEDDGIGRSLRRSPRISRPSVKVSEVKDQNLDKKRSDEEEKQTAQQHNGTDEEAKPEKENSENLKKQTKPKRRRARWTAVSRPRSRRNRKFSSEEESADSLSEGNSEKDSKGDEETKESSAPGEDDEPCKKCGLPNHPELILLCDSCDSGYHTACLRPPLMIIPDGEWYCPPCQHKLLCEKLEEQLQSLDVVLKKRARAERRKERLVYVGISLENIIPTQEPEIPEVLEVKKKDAKKAKPLERRSTRTRKCISYRFDEFDEAIDEAIEHDIRDSEGGGGGGFGIGKDMANITAHRGKDMSTILEEERKENKRPQRAAAARRKKRRRLNDLDSDSNLDEDESEDEFRISDGSQEDFVVSDENIESDEDLQSNDSDGEIGARKPRRHYARPVRKSRRLRRRTAKTKYSDDDEEEETDDDDDAADESESNYSEYSDDYLETRRRRSRRNAQRMVNYREDSESEGSKSGIRLGRGKELRRVLKRRHSTSDSDGSIKSKDSTEEFFTKRKKLSLRKLKRVSDDDPTEHEAEKPIRKRLNRIETDDEDEVENKSVGKDKDGDEEKPATEDKLAVPPSRTEGTKKSSYRIESDEDDFDNVSKVESPLDYSLVDLPSTNGQSTGKTIENLIGKPSDKSQAPKDSTENSSLAPNGTSSGQDVIAPEEDEDELLRVTDLVDYVCNSEQL